MPRNTNRTIDTLLQLKDAGAIVASAAAQVGGVDKVVTLGSGRVDAIVQIDVTAMDVVTGDEVYDLYIEGSTSPTFASAVVPLGNMNLGGATGNQGSAVDLVGRYEIHFTNERNGTIYPYVRMYTKVGGTSPSINYVAYIVKK